MTFLASFPIDFVWWKPIGKVTNDLARLDSSGRKMLKVSWDGKVDGRVEGRLKGRNGGKMGRELKHILRS